MSYELPAVIFETADRKALRHRLLLEDIATNANSLLIRRMAGTKVKFDVEHIATATDVYDVLPDQCPDCPRLYKGNTPGSGDYDITISNITNLQETLDAFRSVRVGKTITHRVDVDCPRCGRTHIPLTYVGRNEP